MLYRNMLLECSDNLFSNGLGINCSQKKLCPIAESACWYLIGIRSQELINQIKCQSIANEMLPVMYAPYVKRKIFNHIITLRNLNLWNNEIFCWNVSSKNFVVSTKKLLKQKNNPWNNKYISLSQQMFLRFKDYLFVSTIFLLKQQQREYDWDEVVWGKVTKR